MCQHFGIDTSDYSFGYVAGWVQGKELPELKDSLSTIRKASADIITTLDDKLQEIMKVREEPKISIKEKLEEGKEKASQMFYVKPKQRDAFLVCTHTDKEQYIKKIRDRYDYILIGCMPPLRILTVNALACADSVLIPVQAAY